MLSASEDALLRRLFDSGAGFLDVQGNLRCGSHVITGAAVAVAHLKALGLVYSLDPYCINLTKAGREAAFTIKP